jgi:hypothetical protein
MKSYAQRKQKEAGKTTEVIGTGQQVTQKAYVCSVDKASVLFTSYREISWHFKGTAAFFVKVAAFCSATFRSKKISKLKKVQRS